MNGWRLTKVWNVDGKMFVADTITEAIELYKVYHDTDRDPVSVTMVGGCGMSNSCAVIRENSAEGGAE